MNARRLLAMVVLTAGICLPRAHAQVTQIIDSTGDGAGETFRGALGIAVAPSGDVYATGANTDNVFRIAPDGTVSLFAEFPGTRPAQVQTDAAGNVFVLDRYGPFVYKISPTGTVRVVLTALGDGVNPHDNGEGLAVGANGIAYASGSGCLDPDAVPCPIALSFTHVFRISPSALPERVLDQNGGGLHPLIATVERYDMLAVDSAGNVYAGSNGGSIVFKVTPSNDVSIALEFSSTPRFDSPLAMTTDAADNLYVITEQDRIFRVAPGGAITELPYTGQPSTQDSVYAMVAGTGGTLYLAGNTTSEVIQRLPDGTTTVIIDGSGDGVHPFQKPEAGGLAVDASGRVYAVGSESDNAFKILAGALIQLTSAEQKCVNGLNKGLRKVSKAQAKDVLACVADGAKGELGPMTVDGCVVADRNGKVQKARAKVQLDDERFCVPLDVPYGATNGATVNAAATNAATMLTRDLLGADLDAAVAPQGTATATCQGAVAKKLAGCADAHLNSLAKCKKVGLKSTILNKAGIAACLGQGTKIAKACAAADGKVRAELAAKCAGVDLVTALPGRCAAGDVATVAQCLEEAARCRACRAAKNADALSVDCDLFDDGQADGSCVPVCGDSIVEGIEACDDGNTTSEDGCSSACAIESCGDGTIQAGLGEGCDDGNEDSLDGCTATCVVEFCGDDVTNNFPNELCDGADDRLCPGECLPDCSCTGPITVGDHECRPASSSVIQYYDSPTTPSIDSELVSGVLDVQCGQVDEITGQAPCTCTLTEPFVASGLALVCFNPTGESCDVGTIDCDGGDALDVDVVADHDIGSCTSHPACATQCDTHCAGSGAVAVSSACEGRCRGGANDNMACTVPNHCPGGTCVGWPGNTSFTVAHPDTCGCQCRAIGGNPSSAGGLSCQVAVEAVVETNLPCGDGDVQVPLGKQCLQLTSQVSQVTLLDTVLGPIGPIGTFGAPKVCTELGVLGAQGLKLTGSIPTFHGNLDRDTALVYDLMCE